MQILKRILTMVLVLAFVLVPLASCSAQLKLPKEEKKEEVVKLSYGEKLRQSVEVDPLFGDASPVEVDSGASKLRVMVPRSGALNIAASDCSGLVFVSEYSPVVLSNAARSNESARVGSMRDLS